MANPGMTVEMAQQALDARFAHRTTLAAARSLDMDPSTFRHRVNWAIRKGLKPSNGLAPPPSTPATIVLEEGAVIEHEITDGVCLIGSDVHIWPGPLSRMQRAFLVMIKRLRPDTIILNGDVIDGARISRHANIGWENKPTAEQEIQAAKDYLGEIARLRPQAKRFWPLGNHDARLETYIANHAPEFAKIHGVHLKDHFPHWIPCWRVDINDDIVVRHRELGGEHAAYRNVVTAGKTMVTGHDHRSGIVLYRNYNGLLYGIRTGYMQDSSLSPQFRSYLEGKEPNWHPSITALTFIDGRLMMPEQVTGWDDNNVQFRGEIIPV